MRPAGAMSPQPRAEWSATERHPGTNETTPRVADAIIDHTPYRGKTISTGGNLSREIPLLQADPLATELTTRRVAAIDSTFLL